ncbi:hypothetical protein HG536_0A06040 [Torulaspora globosa]|uniref:Uncharacterized protein n=1 Tax=Torulaspora globosa TaxID=48254 RepID=A0A7G3ZBA3_9SACH|nr:uncharacterized protein HG536_0A06040 [Torulaspora globosa]QLL30789.1 hypothetical protein HG536_0A06040 [Torulaspora globosa]
MSGKDGKQDRGIGNPPSYEETMRQDAAARDAQRGYSHTPRVNSKRGFPGGQKLTYHVSKKESSD